MMVVSIIHLGMCYFIINSDCYKKINGCGIGLVYNQVKEDNKKMCKK